MKPDAAVAKPTTISSAARVGVHHNAVAAAKVPNIVVKRISNSSSFSYRISVRFLQRRLHRLQQASSTWPSAPGQFPIAGEAGWHEHQYDDGDDPDRDLLNPIRDREGQTVEADALFQVPEQFDRRRDHDDAGDGTAEAIHA